MGPSCLGLRASSGRNQKLIKVSLVTRWRRWRRDWAVREGWVGEIVVNNWSGSWRGGGEFRRRSGPGPGFAGGEVRH